MKKLVFQFLSLANKRILPSYTKRDLTNLSKFDKAIIGYRIWVTKNYLDLKNR